MASIVCPHCGRRGSVPTGKVNVRLHCPACHAGFHIAPGGRAIAGDPPPPVTSEHHAADKHVSSKVELIDHVLMDRMRMLVPLLKILALLVVIGLGMLSWPVASRLWTPLPATLELRALMVGNAFVADDVATIKSLCMPGTAPDAGHWVQQLRPVLTAAWDTRTLLVFPEPPRMESQRGRVLIRIVSTEVPLREVAPDSPEVELGFHPRAPSTSR